MEQTEATITIEDILAAYEGNRKFVRDLVPGDLSRTAGTRFGVMTLGQVLMTSYESHIGNFHVPQLEAFLIPSSSE